MKFSEISIVFAKENNMVDTCNLIEVHFLRGLAENGLKTNLTR